MNGRHSNSLFTSMRRSGWALVRCRGNRFGRATESRAQYVSTNHVREAVRSGLAREAGRLPQSQVLSLDIVLAVRDQAALGDFLAEVYNPRSSSYRHFLTVSEFTEKFGPTLRIMKRCSSTPKINGLTVTGGSRDGMEVQVKGPGFSGRKGLPRIDDELPASPRRTVRSSAPDREPTTSLGIFAMARLRAGATFSIPHPLFVKKSDYAAAHGIDA